MTDGKRSVNQGVAAELAGRKSRRVLLRFSPAVLMDDLADLVTRLAVAPNTPVVGGPPNLATRRYLFYKRE